MCVNVLLAAKPYCLLILLEIGWTHFKCHIQNVEMQFGTHWTSNLK